MVPFTAIGCRMCVCVSAVKSKLLLFKMTFHKRKMRQLLEYFILFFYFVKLKTYRELLQKKSLQQKKNQRFHFFEHSFFFCSGLLCFIKLRQNECREEVQREEKKNMRTIYTRAASSLVIEFAILNPSVNVRSFST